MNNSKHVFPRHKIIASILRGPVYLFFKLFFGYSVNKYNLKNNKPYLILSNHIGAYDPILISLSFNVPIYYVASDHLFRLNFISKLLNFCFAPIPIAKTSMDIKSIKSIKRVTAQKGCIGLFPSGNGSFNGKEAYITDSIGKLAKLLNIPIILYNLDGLYFSTPRWGKKRRRGFSTGQIVKELSIEEVNQLPSDDLSKIIIESLKTDAYEFQNENMYSYKGSQNAMYLERVLYICPKCKTYISMHSKKNIFYCDHCKNTVTFTDFGYFKAFDETTICFATITHWDEWQKQYILERYKNDTLFTDDTPLYTDLNIDLFSCQYSKKNTFLANGIISLFSDRIEFQPTSSKKTTFFIEDIMEIQAILGQTLQFTMRDGMLYETKSNQIYCATKYVHIINLIKSGGGVNGLFSI